jgi:hypothetical protein
MTHRQWGMVVAAAAICVAAVGAGAQPASAPRAQEVSGGKLDYQYYKTKVEPIFLKKRGEHARCYACHSQNNSFFHLQTLAPGSATWTEEQSRQNFQSVSHLVTPGDMNESILLHHPLAPESGGDSFHSGGRQFESKDDPDWKIMAEWVRLAKPGN